MKTTFMKHIQQVSRRSRIAAVLAIGSGAVVALAATVPNSFTAGSPAVAADVNANFQALATALTAAEAKITALETKLAGLGSNPPMPSKTGAYGYMAGVTATATAPTTTWTSTYAQSFNSTGGTNTLTRTAVGTYNVRMTGLQNGSNEMGVWTVTPWSTNNPVITCSVLNLGQGTTDAYTTIYCANVTTGALADPALMDISYTR